MTHRPPELIRIDITRPNSEREAIKNNRDLSAMHAEGWEIAYCWVTVIQEEGNTDQSLLNVVMVPPRPVAPQEPREELGQLLTHAQTGAAAVEAIAAQGEAYRGLLGDLSRHAVERLGFHALVIEALLVANVVLILMLVGGTLWL